MHRDLSSQPAQITNNNGFLLLRQGATDTPLVLAHDFLLTDGNVTVTVPDVVTGDDYSVTCKQPLQVPRTLRDCTLTFIMRVTVIGDSGDHSDTFTINGVFSF